MNRILHLLLSVLILLSTPVGTNVQTAVFDSSDDVKLVSVYTSAQELNPVFVGEAKSFERNIVRSQKKSASSSQRTFNENVALFEKADFSFSILSFSSSTQSSSRVLLLPKTLQTIFFLQTLL